jgi:nucleoside-diphosphate-sugar epimerase
MARRIARLRGRRIPVRGRSAELVSAGDAVDRLVADPRRAERLLGWRARTPLGAGLEETIRWMDAR